MKPLVGTIAGTIYLGLLSTPALSGEAVDRFNTDVGGNISFTDGGEGVVAGGDLSFPIGRYFGGSAQAGYEIFNGDDVGDTAGYTVGAGLFAGDKDIGRIGFQYSNEELEYEASFGDVTIDSDVKRIIGEVYIQSVTLGYWQSDSESDIDRGFLIDSDIEVSAASVDIYPTNQSRIGLVKYGKDDDRIEMRAEYQFDRRGSLFAKYWSNDNADTDAFIIGMTFYFKGGDSLIENDRHY